MPIVSDSQRKNAFSHRLKSKREKSSGGRPPRSEMTPDEIKVAEKAYRETSVWMFNLSVAIRDPSPGQGGVINEWLDELQEKIENIRSRLL